MDKKALERIAEKIRDDANRKIEEYRTIAEEKRQEILKKSARELERELHAMREKREREISNMVNYTISQAKMERKRSLLVEKEKGIDAIFDETFETIGKKDRDRYTEFLKKGIRHIKDVLGEGSIICRPSDESLVRSMLPPDMTLKPGLPEDNPGIIGISKDGKMSVDFTVERRLRDMKEDLRKEISEILYGGSE